jgi:methanogenic corrinoid protein MtbC1
MGNRTEESLFEEIMKGLMEFNSDQVKRAVQKALDEKMDPLVIQESGLRRGLEHLGELFEKGEVFIPHLMLGAKIFN